MPTRGKLRAPALCSLIFMLAAPPPALPVQQKSGKEKVTTAGRRVLWRAPDDILTRDLYLGPGGERMRPAPGPLTFLEDEKGGYSVKWRVRDAAGREWSAKLGREAQAETAALRLVWAVGYMTEVNYLVPCAHVTGAPRPRKQVARCEGDGFADVRLKTRPEGYKKAGDWDWGKNPFVGTRELDGLAMMMALLNNWDLKKENNKIYYVPSGGGGGELRYMVTDLGASFGRVKVDAPVLWHFMRDRNDPKSYADDPFVEDVTRGRVNLFYKGKREDLFDDISVGDARWLANLLTKLSDKQIGDAFAAANYTPEEVRLLTGAVRSRIKELASIT